MFKDMARITYPPEAIYDRENSYEHQQLPSNGEPIPIDPALGGPIIDPALIQNGMNGVQEHVSTSCFP
jgi:hypothetical protein